MHITRLVTAAQIEAQAAMLVSSTEVDATRTLLEDLPFLAETISSGSADQYTRLAALKRIASSLVTLASSGDELVTSRFDTSIVDRIVAYCQEEASLTSVAIQGNGLSLLSNLTYLGELELVVHSGAPSLYVTLLTAQSTPQDIFEYAAMALGNLTATSFGLAALSKNEYASVVGVLEALLEDGDLSQRAGAVMAMKNIRIRKRDHHVEQVRQMKAVAKSRKKERKARAVATQGSLRRNAWWKPSMGTHASSNAQTLIQRRGSQRDEALTRARQQLARDQAATQIQKRARKKRDGRIALKEQVR